MHSAGRLDLPHTPAPPARAPCFTFSNLPFLFTATVTITHTITSSNKNPARGGIFDAG
jgi:hypothetical protein